MKKIATSRLTINIRVKPVNTFNARSAGWKKKRKNPPYATKDTHIQVPGTVEAAATATTSSDRTAMSRPLPRVIVIFLPLQASEETTISL